MTPSLDLSQAIDRMRRYIVDERPLNIEEMKDTVFMFDQFSTHFKNIVRNEGVAKFKDWRICNSWNNAKILFGQNNFVL